MVCETDKMTGISGAIANQTAWLQEMEDDKKQTNEDCSNSYSIYNKAYATYKRSSSATHQGEASKKAKEEELRLLRIEMKIKIGNATTETERKALKIYYDNLIENLEKEIQAIDKENIQLANASTSDMKTTESKKSEWGGNVEEFLWQCSQLFNGYLHLGALKRSEHLADATQNLRTNLDYLG